MIRLPSFGSLLLILLRPSVRLITRALSLRINGLGTFSTSFMAAETGDAPLGNIASQFQVLFLVFTDRHQISVIEKDVRGHQNGIVQKADETLSPCLTDFSLN